MCSVNLFTSAASPRIDASCNAVRPCPFVAERSQRWNDAPRASSYGLNRTSTTSFLRFRMAWSNGDRSASPRSISKASRRLVFSTRARASYNASTTRVRPFSTANRYTSRAHASVSSVRNHAPWSSNRIEAASRPWATATLSGLLPEASAVRAEAPQSSNKVFSMWTWFLSTACITAVRPRTSRSFTMVLILAPLKLRSASATLSLP